METSEKQAYMLMAHQCNEMFGLCFGCWMHRGMIFSSIWTARMKTTSQKPLNDM